MTCGHILDDRTEEAVLLLKAALVFGQELIEVVEQHPIKDSPLRMSRTIDSCHGGRMASRNGPSLTTGPHLLEKTGKAPARKAESGR